MNIFHGHSNWFIQPPFHGRSAAGSPGSPNRQKGPTATKPHLHLSRRAWKAASQPYDGGWYTYHPGWLIYC